MKDLSRSTKTGQTRCMKCLSICLKNKEKWTEWKTHLERAAGRGQVKISHHESISSGVSGQRRGRTNKQPPIITVNYDVSWLQFIWKANTAGTSFISLSSSSDWSLQQLMRKYDFLFQIDTHTYGPLMNPWHSGDEPTLMLSCNAAAEIISWFKGLEFGVQEWCTVYGKHRESGGVNALWYSSSLSSNALKLNDLTESL